VKRKMAEVSAPITITDEEKVELDDLNMRLAKARSRLKSAQATVAGLEAELESKLLELAEKHGFNDLYMGKVFIDGKRFVPSTEVRQLIAAQQQQRR